MTLTFVMRYFNKSLWEHGIFRNQEPGKWGWSSIEKCKPPGRIRFIEEHVFRKGRYQLNLFKEWKYESVGSVQQHHTISLRLVVAWRSASVDLVTSSYCRWGFSLAQIVLHTKPEDVIAGHILLLYFLMATAYKGTRNVGHSASDGILLPATGNDWQTALLHHNLQITTPKHYQKDLQCRPLGQWKFTETIENKWKKEIETIFNFHFFILLDTRKKQINETVTKIDSRATISLIFSEYYGKDVRDRCFD